MEAMSAPLVRVNREGAVVLPDALRQRFGLREGSAVIAEERADGILLRPADLVEMYTPERKAEFLLGNAANPEEYAEAVAEVRRMGLDPEKIEHFRPAGV
jgi:AbrB family looped-hinge helix DNA binding protein